MNPELLRSAYQNFFVKSDTGKYFIAELERQISAAHEDAERLPEFARDYSQRAKGTRNVLDHIQSVSTEVKKGKPDK